MDRCDYCNGKIGFTEYCEHGGFFCSQECADKYKEEQDSKKKK